MADTWAVDTYPVPASQPTLSFGGVAEPLPITTTSQPLTFGSSGGSGTTISSLIGSAAGLFSLGTPVSGGSSGSTTTAPTTTVASVNGQTGYVSGLKNLLGGILTSIGSTGDGAQVQPASWGQPAQPAGMSGTTLLALAAAGAAVYLIASK